MVRHRIVLCSAFVRANFEHDPHNPVSYAPSRSRIQQGVAFEINGKQKRTDLCVMPILDPITQEEFFLILFEKIINEKPIKSIKTKGETEASGSEVTLLKKE